MTFRLIVQSHAGNVYVEITKGHRIDDVKWHPRWHFLIATSWRGRL